MLSTLRNAWNIPELRKRIMFTFFIVALFRMGTFITVPGIDLTMIEMMLGDDSLLTFYDMMAGGAFANFSILALGVTPYINASIIFNLLTVAIPRLEDIQKEGAEGKKKIQKWTKLAAVAFAILQSFAILALIQSFGALPAASPLEIFTIVVTLVTGTMILIWLGELITNHGIGNGVSIIIFVNIISTLPQTMIQLFESASLGYTSYPAAIVYLVITGLLLLGVIVMNLAERRIPVKYAGKAVGGRMAGGQSSHIPVNINSSAVISIIFAMSVMMFPATVAQVFPNSTLAEIVANESIWNVFNQGSLAYGVLFFVLIVFFCWFYTGITLKPEEMAENMNKSSGFIPGIRPGEPTREFLEKVIGRIAIIGGCYVGLVAIFPILAQNVANISGIALSGSALMIVVSVSQETMRTLESQLVMRHYQGFLK